MKKAEAIKRRNAIKRYPDPSMEYVKAMRKETGQEYHDIVSLPQVAEYVRMPNENIDQAYERVVEAVIGPYALNAPLRTFWVCTIGMGEDENSDGLPYSRWAWVENWLNA
jgi:hypothetical protein